MSRCYTLAKRGLTSSGELEMIYKTNISISVVEGVKIDDIEHLVRSDLMSEIDLSRYAPLYVTVDMRDETISVVIRPHNNGEMCGVFKSYIEIDND